MKERLSKRVAVLVLSVVATAAAGVIAPAATAETRTVHPDVTIATDKEFDEAHAVRSGSGTKQDPYVISGWQISSLVIHDTNRWITIKDNTIGGLVLDWIGSGIAVRNNVIGNMVVNQNVARTGSPTSGVIEWNAFSVISQLRHWDGVFRNNVVGTRAQNPGDQTNLAVNFDGFNGAQFVNNTLYGYLDARLHGHHHSSKFGGASHNHGLAPEHQHPSTSAEKAMHRYRYHRVNIANNRIYSDHEYAVAYLDTDHAANDRTAASETNPDLENPHLHFTRVTIANNRMYGAGVLVNVFNALDERHPWTERGSMDIHSNAIELGQDSFLNFRQLNGIEIRRARDLDVRIRGNSITGITEQGLLAFLEDGNQDAGIFLNTLDDSNVYVLGNRVTNRSYGVRAATMTEHVKWVVRDLRTRNVGEKVHYDQSVSNRPQR